MLKKSIVILCCAALLLVLSGCHRSNKYQTKTDPSTAANLQPIASVPLDIHLVVLGVAQDAGYPQADCKKSCCTEVWDDHSKRRLVSCLGIRNPTTKKVYLFDATPDFRDQLQIIKNSNDQDYELGGIFLTHAHIGHYTGLMQLGREVFNAEKVPTYVMPRMSDFLSNNGPWDSLVDNGNIDIQLMVDNTPIVISQDLSVTPLLVPHRDEYSETVGFMISGPNSDVLFIPDIDKWNKWKTDITQLIKSVDYAFLDGTFYRNGEIWGRDMSEIPHPFITESIKQFDSLPNNEKEKIHFIHLNHTNPLLNQKSEEYINFSKTYYHIAQEGQIISL
jgi:pyrroloquinoline quinone biosynthesis protein B